MLTERELAIWGTGKQKLRQKLIHLNMMYPEEVKEKMVHRQLLKLWLLMTCDWDHDLIQDSYIKKS